MSHFILLPATGRKTDVPVFATGLHAARLLHGHLAFLHVRPDVRQEIAAFAAGDFGLGTGIDTAMADLEHETDLREHAAAQAWQAFCQVEGVTLSDTPGHDGVTAEWLNGVGNLAAWLAEHGRAADLVVVGRGRENGGVALDVMESALMETGRPVLIAPETPAGPLDGTVAIAWKDTSEAAGAVAAARPFICRARQVIVFAVEEPGEIPDPSPRRLLRSLRWQNQNTSMELLRRNGRPPVEVLLAAAARAGASLLVMGGYSHTRLREAVFGGFTRAVLENASLPVLMAH
jgi:nucleotide-binding universal stress UspA family protein